MPRTSYGNSYPQAHKWHKFGICFGVGCNKPATGQLFDGEYEPIGRFCDDCGENYLSKARVSRALAQRYREATRSAAKEAQS